MVGLWTLPANWFASKGHRHDIKDVVSTRERSFSWFSSKSQHRILRVIRNKGRLLRNKGMLLRNKLRLLENKVRLLISRGGLLGDKAEMICEEGIHKTFTK